MPTMANASYAAATDKRERGSRNAGATGSGIWKTGAPKTSKT
jgi:hypothetical protein